MQGLRRMAGPEAERYFDRGSHWRRMRLSPALLAVLWHGNAGGAHTTLAQQHRFGGRATDPDFPPPLPPPSASARVPRALRGAARQCERRDSLAQRLGELQPLARRRVLGLRGSGRIWALYFGPVLLGRCHERDRVIVSAHNRNRLQRPRPCYPCSRSKCYLCSRLFTEARDLENRRLYSRLFVHYVGLVPLANRLPLRLTQ